MKPGDDIYHSPTDYDLTSLGVPGDVAYFSKLAKKAGHVLELACGTGRVTLPMARTGARVTGLELNEDMLTHAQTKADALDASTCKRLTLVHGDMRDFKLRKKFPLIVIPFRAFQHLLTVPEQRSCLGCCRKHLAPGGRLVIDLFDPNLRILGAHLSPGTSGNSILSEKVRDPATGETLAIFATRTACPEEQTNREDWVYERFDKQGKSLRRELRTFYMRYFFRYEMEHLFELCGFEVLKLEGDFKGGAFKHGGEQIWTVTPAPKGQKRT